MPTVFISSPSLAEQVLKTYDTTFANRPYTEVAELLSDGFKDLAFSEYGPYWRGARKLCVTHLLNPAKLDSYESIRQEEMESFIESLKKAAKDRRTVDIAAQVRSLVADIVCRIVMGRKCMEESMDGAGFSEHIREVMRLLGSFNLNDYLPLLKPFDLQGIRKQTMAAKGPIDRFLDTIIDEHVKQREEGKKQNVDFVDHLLDSMNDVEYSELGIGRTSIKGIILNMLEGSVDEAPGAIEWAFTELLRHPEAMKKAREELERVVGMDRSVRESDIPKLTYLGMVIKETLRRHALVPFLLHHTKEEFVLDGYKIPLGSNVMICAWAMARDPNLWPNADEFIPERFENSSIDVKGHDYRFLPFGSGRRGCAGMMFGLLLGTSVLAQLVHCFDWELPNGMSPLELDMKEKFGLTMTRAVHLRATPVYRLRDHE